MNSLNCMSLAELRLRQAKILTGPVDLRTKRTRGYVNLEQGKKLDLTCPLGMLKHTSPLLVYTTILNWYRYIGTRKGDHM